MSYQSTQNWVALYDFIIHIYKLPASPTNFAGNILYETMRKAFPIFVLAILFLSCKKDSAQEFIDSKNKNDNDAYYNDIIETVLKYPDNGSVEITLPIPDRPNRELELADIKNKKLEIVEILKKKGFKVIDSAFERIDGIYYRHYWLERGKYGFGVWRGYEQTKLMNVYIIRDRINYSSGIYFTQ